MRQLCKRASDQYPLDIDKSDFENVPSKSQDQFDVPSDTVDEIVIELENIRTQNQTEARLM